MEFDHVTNQYLYPDRYIKMIRYFIKKKLSDVHVELYKVLNMHFFAMATDLDFIYDVKGAIFSVSDPEISKGGPAPEREGGTPQNCEKLTYFGSQIFSFNNI
jgi:hypothetical protein